MEPPIAQIDIRSLGAICSPDSHLTWMADFLRRVQSEETLDEADIADTRACELGRWLYGEGLGFNGMPEYEALCYYHDSFHRVAAGIARLSQAGEKAAAIAWMRGDDTLSKSSRKLVWAITKLRTALTRKSRGSAEGIKALCRALNGKSARDLHTIEGDTLVGDAIRFMRVHKTHYLVVLSGTDYLGIFSEREFLRHWLWQGVAPFALPVAACLDRDTQPVEADASLEHFLALMLKTEKWQLPVMEDDRFIGVVTIGDVIARMMSEDEGRHFLTGGYAEVITLLRAL